MSRAIGTCRSPTGVNGVLLRAYSYEHRPKLFRRLCFCRESAFTSFPYAFPQCWRRYLKEGRESTHVWNAGKYLSAMLAVTVRLWYLNSASTAGLVLGVMAAAVATAYQAYWDVVVDWGLLQRHARRPWLRDRLLVKQQSLYFLAMVRERAQQAQDSVASGARPLTAQPWPTASC